MSDDIVGRIQQMLWRAPSDMAPLLRDALDEIARLRNDVELQADVNRLLRVAAGLEDRGPT